MPDPRLKLDPEPEVLVVRVPGLRGIEIFVTVPRAVWLWFHGVDHVVGSSASAPALDAFRTRTSGSALAFFRQALEEVPHGSVSPGRGLFTKTRTSDGTPR